MSTLAFMMILDSAYILYVFLPCLALGLLAQMRVKAAYSKASKIRSSTGMSGAEAAAEIMAHAGMHHVKIERVSGWLSDHYDPRSKTLRLSPDVYDGRSLASLGIAAHEAGHALQDAKNYGPLVIRNGMVPMASIGSNLGFILLFAGLFLNMMNLAMIGVALFAVTVLFQLINLPVEFDASKRAREQLLSLSMVTTQEDGTVAKVLNAAAMTYVAALVTALANLLYYVMLIAASRD